MTGSASPRLVTAAAVLAVLLVYYGLHTSLPPLSTWWDVAVTAVLVIPAVFALVWLALPLRRSRALLPAGLAAIVLAFACRQAGLDVAADFAKLGAATALAFWLLRYFESAVWVALAALIVPWVDAYSVFAGPTESIAEHRGETFTTLTFALPLSGEPGALHIGLPDVLFFALYLAAAARFRLRPGWTWLALCASLGLTTVIAVGADVSGLPALPGLSLGFLVPNLDLVWRDVRRPNPPSEGL